MPSANVHKTIERINKYRAELTWWHRVKMYWKWQSPISTWLRSLQYGVENLIAYRKLIWRDRDWDFAFLYALIEFKLQRMAELQAKYGCSADRYHYAAEMEEAAQCLRRVREDDYELWEMNDGKANSYIEQQVRLQKDLDRFSELFRTRSLGWWD